MSRPSERVHHMHTIVTWRETQTQSCGSNLRMRLERDDTETRGLRGLARKIHPQLQRGKCFRNHLPFFPFWTAWPVASPNAGAHNPRVHLAPAHQRILKSLFAPLVGDGTGRYRSANVSLPIFIYEGFSLNGRVAHYFVCARPGKQPQRLSGL